MKEIKYILRYVKEYNLYNNFKFRLKYFKHYANIKTTQELLQKAPIIKHNFIFLRFISFPGETNQYYTPFQLFVYNQNKQFYKDMFVDFLDKNNIYERFVCRIDRNNIKHEIQNKKRDKFIFVDHNKNNIINTIFDNLTPPSFMIFAFNWNLTPEKEIFWCEYNEKWIKLLRENTMFNTRMRYEKY